MRLATRSLRLIDKAVREDAEANRLFVEILTAKNDTEIVLRAMLHYDRGSLIIRELYKLEPFFEVGVNVGLGLVLLDGIERHASALSTSRGMR